MDAPIRALLEPLGEIADLSRAGAMLAWDERTQMPPRGAGVRAEQLATLTRIAHERLVADELGQAIEAAAASLDGAAEDSFEASLVRVARRDWEKARRVPAELAAEIARVTSISEHAWAEAREQSDFAAFLPHLERVIDLQRRYIDCFDVEHPYDALLDDYEPGMRTVELAEVLRRLREGLVPLVEAIAASDVEVDDSPLYGEFDAERQAALARELAAALPLEPGAWRLDTTVHPFATSSGVSDVRITTRFDPQYVGSSLWAVIHECGHALYHNGIDPQLERTPLCRSVSLGFDESQSRMWENWVGRGRPFLRYLVPMLARHFPHEFASLQPEVLYRAANRVRPSLIRVEADEVTYNLHVALRFELEVALFEEKLTPAELPEAWNAKTKELLGIDVPDDAAGVLQDVHWPSGAFGYFPTYSLGNVIAGQVWNLARQALPDLDEQLAGGELNPLRDFLGERIYAHGGKFEPAEMIERVVGGPLDPEPLLTQLREKFGELYAL
ncbi:MAG TPA: carboxypeptidase M32 [Solirubrobacterales bacterium]|nr:carboxypeptidase M32 [Solirubrobacterales bacterium]